MPFEIPPESQRDALLSRSQLFGERAGIDKRGAGLRRRVHLPGLKIKYASWGQVNLELKIQNERKKQLNIPFPSDVMDGR